MKRIDQEELYQHLSLFLKSKGIEMKDGSYAQTIQKGCSILTDAVNLTQQGMERAKTELDKGFERMRQVIHEKTAPKASPAPAKPESRQTKATATPSQPESKVPLRQPKSRPRGKKSGRKGSA